MNKCNGRKRLKITTIIFHLLFPCAKEQIQTSMNTCFLSEQGHGHCKNVWDIIQPNKDRSIDDDRSHTFH